MYATAFPDPVHEGSFYADVPAKRLIAWVIDTVLIAFLVALLIPLTGFLALFFLGGLYLVVNFLYRWIGLSRHSATLGMRLMGVAFRDARGLPLDVATAFFHTLGYAVSVAFVVPQVISVLLIAFGRRGQSLSDHVLGTLLVNRAALY
jgi:uncharacterized RDD family membrane protein YckC